MGRYIDADALIMALRLEYPMMPMFKENQKEWEIKTDGHRKAEEVIKDAPSIDIVRCKECRYCLVGVATAQYSNGKQRIENLCEKHKWSVRADDFCSYGERSSE